MNDRRILTAADENAITITAEFYEDGRKLQTDTKRVHRYELDLIVSDEITLDQLLAGIRQGIREKLQQRHMIDPESMTSNEAYDRTLERYEQMQLEAKRRFREAEELPQLDTDGYRPPRHQRRSGGRDGRKESRQIQLTPEQDELYYWLVSWNVFHRCMEMYRKGYPERPSTKVRKAFYLKEYPPHPVVACGSIDLKNWEDGTLLSMARNSQIWLEQQRHGGKTLRELGFATSSRIIFDPIVHHSAAALFEQRRMEVHVGEQVPYYEISDRPRMEERPEVVEILGPDTSPNQKKDRIRHGMFAGMGGLVLFSAIAAVIMFLELEAVYSRPLLMVFAVICAALGVFVYYALCDMEREGWRSGYEEYIRGLIRSIRELQQADAQLMLKAYEPVYDPATGIDLIERTLQVSKCIYSRRPEHEDFLQLRLGLACEGSRVTPSRITLRPMPSDRKFDHYRYQNIRDLRGKRFRVLLPGEAKPRQCDYDGTYGYLNDLPRELAEYYGWMDHVPVMLDVGKERLQTFWYEDADQSFLPLLQNMILDLCVHHAPEDVQLILFCPKLGGIRREQDFIRMFKHLPHFQMLLEDRSAFVFSDEQARLVLDRLQRIRYERNKLQEGKRGCHIVLMVLEEYGLRQHPLSELLPHGEQQNVDDGFSFLFFTHFASKIPPYSSRVIKRTREEEWFCIPHCMEHPRKDQVEGIRDERSYRFHADALFPLTEAERNGEKETRMHQAFRVLSALYHDHMDRSALPSSCDLIRLLEAWSKEQELDVRVSIAGADGVQERKPNPEYVQERWYRNRDESVLRVPIGIGCSGTAALALNDAQCGGHLLIAGDRGTGKTQSMVTAAFSHCIHYMPDQVRLILADVTQQGIISQMENQPHTEQCVHCGEADHAACLDGLLTMLEEEKAQRMKRLIMHNAADLRSYNRWCMTQAVSNDIRIPEWIIILDSWEKWRHLIPQQSVWESLTAKLVQWMKDADRCGMHLLLAVNPAECPLESELLEQFSLRLCLKTEQEALSQLVMGSSFAASAKMPADGRAYLYCVRTGATEYVQMASVGLNQSKGGADTVRITHMDHRGRYKPLCSGYTPGEWTKHKTTSEGSGEPVVVPQQDHRDREAERDGRVEQMLDKTLQNAPRKEEPLSQVPQAPKRTPDRVLPEFAEREALPRPGVRHVDWVDPRFAPENSRDGMNGKR